MLERKARWNTAWAAPCVMTLAWQLCPQSAGDLGDCAAPFRASVSFSDNHHLTDFTWYWPHLESLNLLLESTNSVYYSCLPSSSKYPIGNQKAKRYFLTCKSSYLTALLLSERRWNHRQQTQRRELARRMGGKTIAPFLSPWPPQGTGGPTSPHCKTTIFRGLRGAGTQLLVHEPSFPKALLTISDLVNCIFLKYGSVWEEAVRTFKNCSTLILINRVDWKQNM